MHIRKNVQEESAYSEQVLSKVSGDTFIILQKSAGYGAQCNHNSKHNAKKTNSKWGRNLTSVKFLRVRYSACIHAFIPLTQECMATISKTFPHNNTQLGSKPWLFPRIRMTADVLGQDIHACLAHKYKMHGKFTEF